MVVEFSRPCGQNRINAVELEAVVDALLARTGKGQVDVVGHSMACLSTRLFARYAGADRVDDLVEIAGVCHGTDVAEIAPVLTLSGEDEGVSDMRPAYGCDGVQPELNGCFDPATGERTGAFDETPGSPATLSIYTDTDELVRPFHSACLDQRSRGDCSGAVNEFVPGRSHFTIHQDAQVVARTLSFVRDNN